MVTCPSCESEKTSKNGHIHNGKQRYRCKDCSRQFVLNPTKKIISEETRERIDKLLLEKIPLAGIARSMEVSETWLQSYVNQKYENVPRQVEVQEKRGASHRVRRAVVVCRQQREQAVDMVGNGPCYP